ncbi:hypothetical protein [Actinoplanes sp. NPDC051851]
MTDEPQQPEPENETYIEKFCRLAGIPVPKPFTPEETARWQAANENGRPR